MPIFCIYSSYASTSYIEYRNFEYRQNIGKYSQKYMYILYFFTPACRSYLNIVQKLNIKYSFQNIVEYRSIFTVFTVDKNTLLYSAIFMATKYSVLLPQKHSILCYIIHIFCAQALPGCARCAT